jgi:para-nitrobenzyl esterase
MATVETRYGKVAGVTANGLHAFLGIPFAAPPTGRARWTAPRPPEPWTGVRETASFGRQSWQPDMENAGPLGFAFNARGADNSAEDCLQLNVWTPGLDGRRRPVLVWIHGGGFSGGTGATPVYDGTALARRGDAVVVTINYRLGALGFLNLNEVTGGRIPASGNEGLLDQVMALEWVRDNIEAFGGDPARVTIFGESAGGMSVGALLALPAAKGLFQRAIPQSGACSTAHTLARATEIAQGLLDHLGVSANDAADTLIGLAPDKLVKAGAKYGLTAGGMIFSPCVDGTVLPELPIDAVKRGAADGVPVLVGATRDEWRLFTAMPGFTMNGLDDTALAAVLARNIDDPAAMIGRYREAREARGEVADAAALYAAIESDRIFRIPAVRLAEALAERDQAAYQYLFTWESPWDDGKLGSPHAIDIGFVFGTHDLNEGSAQFFGRGEAADALAGHVQDAWLAFASSGDPRTDALADWRRYDPRDRSTALLGEPVAVAQDPYGPERAAWETIGARVGGL